MIVSLRCANYASVNELFNFMYKNGVFVNKMLFGHLQCMPGHCVRGLNYNDCDT